MTPYNVVMNDDGVVLDTCRELLSRLVAIDDEAWTAAREHLQVRRFEKREHAIRAGQTVDAVLFVVDGLARYYYLTPEGKEFNKSFTGPGDVLSSITSLVAGEPSPFSVELLAPTTCVELSRHGFEEISARYPSWQQLHTRLLETLAIKKEKREADFLLLTATERYLAFCEDYADIASSIPNFHIASYLGITEVALSRIRGRRKSTDSQQRR
ncbi:MAG: Crp/Fnr family transcriptional regulator [Pseudomonadales bacterium]|nr:Crp/Fnr family transcriptional regulator [Pseudomonadales bacterium]